MDSQLKLTAGVCYWVTGGVGGEQAAAGGWASGEADDDIRIWESENPNESSCRSLVA